MPRKSILTLLLPLGACLSQSDSNTLAEVERIAEEVIPRVEQAVGLTFKTEPTLAIRSRDEVARYLTLRLGTDFPPERVEEIATAYRLFGLVPDSLDLMETLLRLLSEQVVGFYDPDSTALYLVEGTGTLEIRLVLAHELVHALQGQYMSLDSLLDPSGNNDRQMAAQAVLEGQATLASLSAMVDEEILAQLDDFWRDIRVTLRQEQESQMPEFAAAPLIFREGLIFPYLAGADFMRWFASVFPDMQPYGDRMPQSTEQILHPEKYRAGDAPVSLRYDAEPQYQDSWGEFETRLVLQELTGSESMGTAGALGWGGDQFAVYPTDGDHALVWWSVWDSEQAARKFGDMLERWWPTTRAKDGRRWRVERQDLDGLPAVLLVDAPDSWERWEVIPRPRAEVRD